MSFEHQISSIYNKFHNGHSKEANKSLEHLCQDQEFSGIVKQKLSEILSSKKTSVDLSNLPTTVKGTQAIMLALGLNTTITTLNFSSCVLYPDDTELLIEALKKNSTITALNLSDNALDSKVAIKLLQALKDRKCTISLDLSQNKIDGKIGHEIGAILQPTKNILSLNMSGNKIGTSAAILIINSAIMNEATHSLGLEDIGINERFTDLISNLGTSKLRKINFRGNQIPLNDCDQLRGKVEREKPSLKIDISGQKIGKHASRLQENRTRTTCHIL